jgi:hypothetical protein
MPYLLPSLPNPDSFTPPNGMATSETSPVKISESVLLDQDTVWEL